MGACPNVLQHISSAESQKGINVIQQCSIEHQKGAIAENFVLSDSPLLVLNETSFSYSIKALLPLN